MLCRSRPKAMLVISEPTAEELEADLQTIEKVVTACATERTPTLTIQHTLVLTLPSSVSQCTQVLALQIDNNYNLRAIPDSVDQMASLERATLSYNCLQTFPRGLLELKYLRQLDLSNNHLKALHRDIHWMKTLEVLILENNNLTCVPPSMLYMPRLQRLSLLNNPLVTEELQVPAGENVVIDEELMEPNCVICQEPLADALPVYNFVDIAGCKQLPVLYVVCSTRCQSAVADLVDSEVLNYSKLVYN